MTSATENTGARADSLPAPRCLSISDYIGPLV